MKPILTIATVTFNCLPYTKLFLASLKKFADLPYQLIVVDNHSANGTPQFLSAQKNIKVILNQKNLGFGRANNQAFKLTKTPYFLGLNNDTVIFPQFLSRLINFAQKHSDFVQFGVNSNCIGTPDPRTKQLVDLSSLSPNFSALRKYYGDFDKFQTLFAKTYPGFTTMTVPPDFIGGWCFLVRTEEVKKAGGLFDPKFKIGFWEDVDLSWRLAQKGGKVCLINWLYLHHFNHISYAKNKLRLKDKTISRKNALYFAQKWNKLIKEILFFEFNKGKNLGQIINQYFIFKVFLGKREDYTELEKDLKKFLLKPGATFKDFLLQNPKPN